MESRIHSTNSLNELIYYSIQDFKTFTFNGFNLSLPEETIKLISKLSLEVGSPTYIKTPIFKKREIEDKGDSNYEKNKSFDSFGKRQLKFNNCSNAINSDSNWEKMAKFTATKLEIKQGIELNISNIRSFLNKMTDKNYNELKNKIIDEIELLIEKETPENDILLVSHSIFDIACNNRFYSKIYANLCKDLADKYDFMKEMFNKTFISFMNIFDNIEYVDPDLDYDLYCKINKDNEKRKSLSMFYVNLTILEFIPRYNLLNVICNLLRKILIFISLEKKKNEVDEISENIFILYKKDLICDVIYERINDKTIEEIMIDLSKSKSKIHLYPSLSMKTIFKFMDIVDTFSKTNDSSK